ncbi:hypothetical protein E7681_04475 [Thalassobius vesicularis]|uniref:DNA primase n=1 Tax=Thalassobius vesicularis TaxID=1294297 RepID=A0A4S3MAW8_9RHOB|nr:hypothetical protein [Thalassobius vesicularis]THD75715.1 hypothetical protein E7681_04475 [Thalassobius vesicularis]
MRQILPITLAGLMALLPVAVLAESKAEKTERCSIQAGIVEAAISHRQANRNQNRATRKIMNADPIKGTKYEANVDVLVAWIYSLPQAQLTPDTTATFEKACLDYKS